MLIILLIIILKYKKLNYKFKIRFKKFLISKILIIFYIYQLIQMIVIFNKYNN